MKATTQQAPGVRWQDLLLVLAFLAAGWANAPASLRIYAAYQRTAGGVFLLLCESGVLAGSAAVLLFTLASVLSRRAAWRPYTRGFMRIAIVSFLGLAWCFGALR
jgi:hypothetical protein